MTSANNNSSITINLRSRQRRSVLFLLCGMTVVTFAVSGILVLALGTQILAAIFLVVALLVRRRGNYHGLWESFFAFFFVFAFVFLTRFVAVSLVGRTVATDSLAGEIIIPVTLFLAVVAPILLLGKTSGRSLLSLYVSKGNVKLGLLIGGVAFIILYVGSLAGFTLAFGATQGVDLTRLFSLTPAVLYLSLWNAPNEELWFRGLFLKTWEPQVGRKWANLLQAPMFALGHYVPEFTRFGTVFVVSFLVLAFVAGLGFGYLIQKTESLIGATLAHIGADVVIYFPVLLGITTAGLGT